MEDFPIAPVVGWNQPATQEIRDFIVRTVGVSAVRVPLSKGRAFALVDREDWIRLELWRWCWSLLQRGAGYAFRAEYIGRKNSKPRYRWVQMHSMILQVQEGLETDHRSRDSLDNRKLNLRPATRGQNVQNQGLQTTSTTGFKGVCFVKRRGDFAAYIDAGGARKHLGYFPTAPAAAAARDEAALRLHGEFAVLSLAA
ncbi:AP2 domain-containing protein [Shumkonia mesophila]|uniref:AP2 domain-containing protein n=1 Tax=Shumkonia mesophila TaxID=2838854 RepID=UPI002934F408|nr:AP2 domain-containing protein [Shumkonia mesophila]